MLMSMSMRLALGALALGSALSVGSPAMAQSETLNSLMGFLGLSSDEDKPEIEYRERAPLVVPPRMELRTPQQSAAAANPNWPTDPDVVKAKKKATAARVPVHDSETYRLNEGKPLSVYEMRAGRMAGAGLNAGPANPYKDDQRAEFWASPEAKEKQGRLAGAKSDQLVAGAEPERQFLTDPPTGYRAPSARGSLALPKAAAQPKLSDNQEASPYEIYRKPQAE
jgi:hypothetical protein